MKLNCAIVSLLFFVKSSYGNNFDQQCAHTVAPCVDEVCDIVSQGCAVAGPAGPRGERGATGPRGATGRSGSDGAQGQRGSRGPAGAAGAPGPAGPVGEKGERGSTGRSGSDGADGATGPAGAPGKDGAPGPQGRKGDTGARGSRGPAGPAGPGLSAALECVTEVSLPKEVGFCAKGGLKGNAGVRCSSGYEVIGCSGVLQDSSSAVLATNCMIVGNKCVCDGCELYSGGDGDYNGLTHSELTAQAQCCKISVD